MLHENEHENEHEPTTTLLLFVLAGSDIVGLSEVVTYYYVHAHRVPPLLRGLMEKCDGTCYDAVSCTDKQRRRLDVMFDMLEDAIDAGHAVKQAGSPRTVIPHAFHPVGRVVTVMMRTCET